MQKYLIRLEKSYADGDIPSMIVFDCESEDIERKVERYCSGFFAETKREGDRFVNAMHDDKSIEAKSITEIPQEDYAVLKKYLPTF